MARASRAGQIALTIGGSWGLLNATLIAALGIATLLGNRLVFEAGGVGPNRIAPASLLGPLANHAGWVLLALAVCVAVMAFGLLRRREWSRQVLLAIATIAAASTLFAMIWAAQRAEWTTMAWGAAKVALYVAIGILLQWRRTRALFS